MRLIGMHAFAWVCIAICSTAAAESIEVPLRFEVALERALAGRAELVGFAYALRAQEGRIGEAAVAPATQLEVMVEDAGGSGERDAFDAAQTTLSLSRVFELGGKLGARTEMATAGFERLMAERVVLQLDVVAEVARRYIDVLEEQALLAIAQQNVEFATRTREAVAQRVKSARVPAVEASRAEVRLTQARLVWEEAEHELASRRRLLAAAMGERTVQFGPVEGDLDRLVPTTRFEALQAALEASPELSSFANDARLRDAELRLAELKQRGDIRGELGVRRFEQHDGTAFVAGLSIPLGSASRAAAAIDVARAERDRVDWERDAWLTRMTAQLFALYQELEHARHEFETLRSDVIPQLESAMEATEFAYQRGRYSYLEWIESQHELLDARRRAYELAAAFHTVRIEIERLTGQSLEHTGVSQ